MTDPTLDSIAPIFFAAAYAGEINDFEGLMEKLQTIDELHLASEGYKAVGSILKAIAAIGIINSDKAKDDMTPYPNREAVKIAMDMFIAETYKEKTPVTTENQARYNKFLDDLAKAAHDYGLVSIKRKLPSIYEPQRYIK